MEEKLKQFFELYEELTKNKTYEMMVAVAMPTEEEGMHRLEVRLSGGSQFEQQIVLGIVKKSGHMDVIQVPASKIFPPKNPKDIN